MEEIEEKDFTQTVDETVNFFMAHAAKHRPEVVLDMAMAVFMNLVAIIPYPATRAAQTGSSFPQEYRNLVMELMPEITVALRGHAAEFIQKLIHQALEKGLMRDGVFEFLGHTYGDIPEPPTDTTN